MGKPLHTCNQSPLDTYRCSPSPRSFAIKLTPPLPFAQTLRRDQISHVRTPPQKSPCGIIKYNPIHAIYEWVVAWIQSPSTRHHWTPRVGPILRPPLVHKYPSPPPPFFPFLLFLSSPSPLLIFTNRSLMLSLDEIFSLPLPALDEGSGFTSWPAPAPTTETGPKEPDRAALTQDEERRRRRKISNRESARRSRMRKQRHLDELRSQGARLRSENRALADHLVATVHRCLIFRRDNNRLRAQSAALHRRLSKLLHVLLLRQHHLLSSPPPPLPQPPADAAACVVFPSGYERTFASLIA